MNHRSHKTATYVRIAHANAVDANLPDASREILGQCAQNFPTPVCTCMRWRKGEGAGPITEKMAAHRPGNLRARNRDAMCTESRRPTSNATTCMPQVDVTHRASHMLLRAAPPERSAALVTKGAQNAPRSRRSVACRSVSTKNVSHETRATLPRTQSSPRQAQAARQQTSNSRRTLAH